ncbi:synaptopodin isoform X2 [Bombina bombina]|uniref:synaptopodin isoform X2 n=1 Tax=Bombina bombina TaxID=8345 RepID=UPI00235A74BF|nr:synaptopodin isoform X2 [Bombina bombina]
MSKLQCCQHRLGDSADQRDTARDITRSVSLTEKELKDAQSISYNNDSQLSPAQSGCSKGALLFHRRRQRIKALEKYIPVGNSETQKIQEPQENKVQHGLKFLETEATEPCTGSGCSTTINMEETSSDIVYSGEIENTWGDDLQGVEFPSIDKRAPSPSASESDNQEPLSAYLKENLVVTNTNGLHNQINHETEPIVKKEQNGMETRQYCEVHLTLSKPKSVANRTAKPFGNQLSAKKNLCSSEKSAVIDLPPPPTYAETLSSPPPVTRIRSPPAYSALYPTEAQHITPVVQVASHGKDRVTPQPKSGILESIGSQRGTKKSMFTFIEKPKMAPNPDLLSMVQTADEKRKQKDQGEVPTEEEPFALGAEASNFQNKTTKAGDNVNKDTVPDWATCLKSPGSRGKPPPAPVQTLTEDKGKGAELFARRQTRMEKFVVESSHNNSIRSPSPTMSLPPSWKFSPNEQASSLSFVHQVKINQRSPKPPVVTSVANPALESDKSRKELEISKRQPYQLKSSLFILSPNKDPVSSLPRAAPPPKPMVLESQRFTRQSSCPPSPIVPSPATNSPTYFRSVQSPSTAMSPTVSDSPIGYGRRTPTNHISPMSPVPFSNTGVVSPRTKAVIQAPRPLFSARNAGLESQKSRDSTSPHKPLQHQTSIDGWESPSSYLPGYREGTGIQSPPPPRPMSPAWSDRSPSPFRVESDLKAGKQMKALIARNIINAAKRKSSSPWGQTSPQSPIYNSGTWSPRMGNGSPLPETPRGRRSPTGSDISLESEDSGAKSPGFRSYPLSPRGWYGSMRLKRDSLPANPSYT